MAVVVSLALLLPAGLGSCAREPLVDSKEAVEAPTVPVQLALHIGSQVSTKADLDALTEMKDNPEFRGMEQVRMIPFAVESAVSAFDPTLYRSISLPHISSTGLVDNNHAYLYTNGGLFLPLRTASVLAYGRAPKAASGTSVAAKHKDGSLREIGLNAYVAEASELGFAPETMLVEGSGTPAAATAIASALNGILFGDPFQINAYYGSQGQYEIVSVPWDGAIGDDNLRDCYEDLTAGGALMPGSGTNVAAMLTNLYRSLSSYLIVNPNQYEVEKDGEIYPAQKLDESNNTYSPLTYADLYKGVRDLVLARFAALASGEQPVLSITGGESPEVSFASQELATYPEQYGLPSGAAVVRWTPAGYVVPLENGLDGIAPISAYCFPPALYYFSNTTLRTSNDNSLAGTQERQDAYSPSNTWDQILSKYTDGHSVSTSTCAVALESALQYAMGMLKATVKIRSPYENYPTKLQDNDNLDYTLVEVSGENFPLTGVIIGRQYPLQFDFTPVYESDVLSKQYYLYDDQISDIYLSTAKSAEFRTLALETPLDKEVYFCLEFQNNSGASFHGAEGRILPGHKFYLVGKLGFPEEGEAAAFRNVFLRDCITTVDCVITTFKNAHSAVPDMGIPQLTVGVETRVNWVMSTPTTLMFE